MVELNAGQGAVAMNLIGDPGQEGQVVHISGQDLRRAQEAGVLSSGVHNTVAQGDNGGPAHGLHPEELHIPFRGMALRRGVQVEDGDRGRLDTVFQGLAPDAQWFEDVGIIFFHFYRILLPIPK